MTATALPAVERIAGYLAACGGSDRFEFHDGFGEPDPIAARAFAERLRERFGHGEDASVSVRQQAHHIIVTLVNGRG